MKPLVIITAVLIIAGCGESRKEAAGALTDKKLQLEALKKEQQALNDKVTKLEQEIATLDPEKAVERIKLVGVTVLETRDFAHYIDLQGRITTENIYYVAPRGMGGQVKAIYVKQGDRVRKGQLLMQLDDAIVQQNLKQLETQLSFAKNIYQRQKNLWDDGIGTEVQYLTARNNVDNLEKQMSLVREQLSFTRVTAEVSGIVETVNIRVGETFTGNPAAGITIVNPSALKATVDIPENYISKIRRGMPVVVNIPDINQNFNTEISHIGELISPTNRSFIAESKVPANTQVKPNQVAVVKILDHQAKNALVVPVETIQSDDKGKYVFVMKEENGKKVARKKPVTVGEFYDELIEVRNGLTAGEQLITRGYQGLYEGQLIDTNSK
jgi:RND family efflux transporter MFP subunit